MKRLKRFISIVLCGCVLCGIVFTQVGAMCKRRPPETYEVGIFKIIKDKYNRFPSSYPIYDFTEVAKQQENLIIPCEIYGKPLFIDHSVWGGPRYTYYNNALNLGKSKMKKVFLVGDLSSCVISELTALYMFNVYEERGLNRAPYLNKIIFNEYYFYDIIMIWSRKDNQGNILTHSYFNIDFYLTIMNKCFYCGGVTKTNFYEKTGYKIKQVKYQNVYNNSSSKIVLGWWGDREDVYTYYWETVANVCRVANVHFMYNYADSPKYGYYWIDDIENGEKIEVIPENPTREGYTFGGWYLEPECVNEFDFNTPIVKNEVDWGGMYKKYAEIPEDYITYLYAKWIEN